MWDYKSSYINGLVNMASSCSTYIGPSFIKACCFDLQDYKLEFAKQYSIPEGSIDIIESTESLERKFDEWLGDEKIVEGLVYWIKCCVGEPVKIFYPKEDSNLEELLSGYNKGISGFYIVEEIFFAQFKNDIVCFILGNNE